MLYYIDTQEGNDHAHMYDIVLCSLGRGNMISINCMIGSVCKACASCVNEISNCVDGCTYTQPFMMFGSHGTPPVSSICMRNQLGVVG